MFMIKKLFPVVLSYFLLLNFSTLSMDEKKVIHHRDMEISTINVDVGDVPLSDPPFYLIETEDGKVIYFLGAMHPLPITKALSTKAFEELGRIANEKPMFITEHSASNKENLLKLKEAETKIKWIDSNDIGHEQKLLFEKIKEEQISIDMDSKSDLQIKVLENIDPWLVLPTLIMHIGSYLKKEFSSFEQSVITIWGKTLLPEHYLEGHEETLLALKKVATHEYRRNIGGINYFLELLLTAKSYKTDKQSELFWKAKFKEYIENYSFKDFDKTERISSTIERNFIWVKTFLQQYYPNGKHFLIIVGTAHLEGPDNFIHLLLQNIKIKGKIKRFSNKEGWKDFL